MSTIQFVRNTPLYLSTIVVKINGEVYNLKSNKTLDLELPAGNYQLLVCNEYEKFEGCTELSLSDEATTTVEVGLKNAKAYQVFLAVLLVAAFLFAFFTEVSSLAIGLTIFAVLAAYWGVEYYNRKSYFTLKVGQKQPTMAGELL